MLLSILRILDMLTVLIIIGLQFGIFGLHGALIAGIYLISKGIMFRDVASRIDFAVGIFVFFIYAGFHTFLTWIVVIYLMQKVFLAFMY